MSKPWQDNPAGGEGDQVSLSGVERASVNGYARLLSEWRLELSDIRASSEQLAVVKYH